MNELYNLKDMLVKELEEFGKKGELTKPSLDVINKLARAAKNIAKIIEDCEQDEYSNASSYRMSYRDGGSYARGGYSRAEDDIKERLHRLMSSASDDHTRNEIRRMIDSL